MRRLWLVLLGALLAVPGTVGTTAAQAAQAGHKSVPQLMREYGFKHKTASWTVLSTQKDETGKTTVSESKLWISGDKYRMEAKGEQGKQMVVLDDGRDLYMYQPGENKAFKWGPGVESMFSNILSSDLVAESARQRKAAKKIGSETVDGKPCTIYAYHSKLTMMNNVVEADVKEWLWTAEKFPLKSVSKTPKHQMKIVFVTTEVPASETTTVVKDLVLDRPVADALFALPAGTQIETMELPPTMGGAGESAAPPAGKTQPAAAGGEDADSGGENQQPPVDVNKMLKGLF